MRLFVAIELPSSMIEKLATLLLQLRNELTGPKWVRAEGIHLTLRFLGEIPQADLPALRTALCAIGEGTGRGFRVVVEGLGLFPERGRPRVLWIGLREETGDLQVLQTRVEAAVRASGLTGFAFEKRPFRPHLTLARIGDSVPPAPIQELVSKHRAANLGAFEVSTVTLFQSLLAPGGAQYRSLQEYPL